MTKNLPIHFGPAKPDNMGLCTNDLDTVNGNNCGDG